MKTTPLVRRALPSAFAAILLAGLPASRAQAGTIVWNNFTGTNQWSVGANWVGGVPPPANDPTLSLVFPGTSSYTSNNDITNILLNNLTLSASVAEALTGNSLDFRIDNVTAPATPVAPTLVQSGLGSFSIANPLILTNALTLSATVATPGTVGLNGVISGASGMTFNSGSWQIGNGANTYTGTTNINAATVEIVPSGAAPQTVNLTPVTASSLSTSVLTINGGTLKVTSKGVGSITAGGRALTFGANGGIVDLTNTSGTAGVAGGNLTGDFNLVANNTGANLAVFRFNGGQLGLSDNTATSSNINSGGNVLRFASVTGAGAVRVELTNGAAARAGNGGTGTVTLANAFTYRGVAGGDPTSGTTGSPATDGKTSNAISLNTGRLIVDNANVINYTGGLTFEDAMLVTVAGSTRAFDGNITIAGTAGGHAGFVVFNGRGTGTVINPTLNLPGTGTAGQNPLYIGQGSNDTLTIQDGGVGVLDLRVRTDQGYNNAVLLNSATVLNAGGTLRVYQSISQNSTFTSPAGAPAPLNPSYVGNDIVQGNITGQGSSLRESALDIYLPAAVSFGTVATPTTNILGGVDFQATSNIVVNGTGFGGLRVNGLARPNNLFAGAGADPVTNDQKVNNYLTTARINAVTGTGGYLTPAPAGATFIVPNAEWAAAVPVGLRVVNQNTAGVDVQFDPSKTSWGHNIAVDAGAELNTGTTAFTMSAGTLIGTGTVSGSGGLIVSNGATISPGFGNIGTLTVGNITLNGSLLEDFTNTPSGDLLSVAGGITLGATSNFTLAGGSTLSGNYTLVSFTGALSGTFGSVTGLPLGYSVNYSIPGQIQLVSNALVNKVWNGTPGNIWSTNAADANWKGPAPFNDTDLVTFDDTAAGSTTVNVSGLVQPGSITFNNSTKNYIVNAPTAADIIGGTALLLKANTGSVTLNGSHTYSGGTTITGGTLTLGNNDVLPNIGAVNVGSGATLDVNGKTDTIGGLTVTGTVTAGTLTVGSLTLQDGAAMNANVVLAGDVTKNGTVGVLLPGTVNLNGATRTFTVAAGTAPELTVGGVISNGVLAKAGPGQLLLNVTNSYAGGTTVTAGTLKAGVAGAIPNGILTINGGTADLNGFAYNASALNGSGGTLAMGGGALTLSNTAAATYAGAITGTGTVVTKSGAGIQTLSGASGFTGGLNITAGRLNLNGATSAGTGLITVASGGSLQSGATVANNVTLSGGTLSSSGSANITTGDLAVSAASTVITFNRDTNAVTDVVVLGTLRGAGDLLVTPLASQTADGGTGLRLRGVTASDYSGTVTVAQSAKFEIQMNDQAAVNPFGNGKLTLTAGTSTGETLGTYSQFQGRLTTDAQTYALNTNVTISGTGYVNYNALGGLNSVGQFGNLRIGGGQILGANKNDLVNRTVAFSSVTLTGGNAEFRAFDPGFGVATNANRSGANIRLNAVGETTAGSGVIFRSGTNFRNELTGVSTYTGPTQVAAGTLRISLGASIANSPRLELGSATKLDVTDFGATGFVIPATQTFAGIGDVDGRIVQSGTLAPGLAGIGTLTGDDYTLNGGAPLKFELSATDTTSDRLGLTGAFTKGTAGSFIFDFGSTGAMNQTYTLATFTSTTFAVTDFSFINLAPSAGATFQLTGTDLKLVVVPEPGAAFSLLAGAGVLLGRRRRRPTTATLAAV